MTELDILIPVYNEGENIVPTLRALKDKVKTPFRVLICYDFDGDDTLPAAERMKNELDLEIVFVKNPGTGVHRAIVAGFEASQAPAVLVYPADEVYNIGIIDKMYQEFKKGGEVVVASRFMKGGGMEGGPVVKSIVVRVASFVLHYIVGIPASDASYGLRLFSKKILDAIQIESTEGFTYAVELLVKCHRLGWKVSEVPAKWYRREKGQSRFNFKKWLPHYFRWFVYAIETNYLRKPASTVKLKPGANIK
ncbi:MAG: glycosyltransferase family 2 protein [Patescibacteria group bacterium]